MYFKLITIPQKMAESEPKACRDICRLFHINTLTWCSCFFLEAGKKNDLNTNIPMDSRLLRYINGYAVRHYGNI